MRTFRMTPLKYTTTKTSDTVSMETTNETQRNAGRKPLNVLIEFGPTTSLPNLNPARLSLNVSFTK